MKYWVYLNDKVTGPFTADKLVTLNGFTPDTLICSEDAANSGNQEWVKASNVFEFEQPAPAPAPAAAAAAPAANAGNDALTAMLLAKIDALTVQLNGMQSKLEGMQTKLDESISSQEKAAQESAERAEALTEQFNFLAATQHDLASQLPKAVTDIPTENLDEQVDDLEHTIPATDQVIEPALQETTQSSQPEDLTPSTQTPDAQEPAQDTAEKTEENTSAAEDDLLSTKEGDDVVLSSALDSLHSKVHGPLQSKDDKEDTFQDLLTPAQAQTLAKEAQAKQPEATPTAEDKKEEVLAELTDQKQEDVVDQLIKEKEEDEHKKSMTMRILSGAAALVGLKKKADSNKAEEKVQVSSEQDLPVLETKSAEEPAPAAEPKTEEKPSLEFDQPMEDAPALTVAGTTPETSQEAEPAAQEEPAPVQEISAEEPQPFPAEAQEPVQTDDELADTQAKLQGEPFAPEALPSLEASEAPAADVQQEQVDDESPEELVPNAQADKPDDIITDADLKDAFAEHKNQEDKSVEQLFGLASAGAAVSAVAAAEQADPSKPEENILPSLDQTNETSAQSQQAAPNSNPNDMTEVQLTAGSTYLISDFVPPASNPNSDLGQALTSEGGKNEGDDSGLEEMVPSSSDNQEQGSQKEEGAPDVTVSQIVLENTIKAKRGAALDIRTVPMVPEPADSDRLQVEGMDDINAQHDLKSADVEPAGKKAKAAVWLVVLALLAGAIYGMLAWMDLIPPQFNVLPGKKQAAVAAQQEEQLNEMLAPTEEQLPVQTVDENTPVAVENPQEAILEEVKNYMLPNGMTLKAFVESKHPAATELITWEISTAVDPDNYSILVKVPPENPQSFKISYRFNYNAVTKALDPTISDAKNLLDSAQPQQQQPQEVPAQ